MELIKIHLECTNYCNLNCSYCVMKTKGSRNTHHWDYEEYFFKFLEKFKKKENNSFFQVIFFGGEPTIKKKEIIKFIELCVLYNLTDKIKFTISTNGLIFFEEFFFIMKKYNLDFFFTLSYDGINQKNRNPIEKQNEKILINIKKYLFLIKSLNLSLENFHIHCCVSEKNKNNLFKNFLFLKNLGVLKITFSNLFPEYWKNDSFKIYNNHKKIIYKYCLKNNLNYPYFIGNHKDYFKKFNPIKNNQLKEKYKKINFYKNNLKEESLKRGLKKTYNIKIFYNKKSFFFNIKNNELNLLRNSSVNKKFFDSILQILLIYKNFKRFKKEIYCLFDFDYVLIKKFIFKIKSFEIDLDLILKKFLIKNKHLKSKKKRKSIKELNYFKNPSIEFEINLFNYLENNLIMNKKEKMKIFNKFNIFLKKEVNNFGT